MVLLRLLLGGRLKGARVWSVRGHAGVEAGTSRKEAVLLPIVLAMNQAHEFAHSVPVKVWGPECVGSNHPPRRKDYKVCNSGAGSEPWHSKDSEDGRVRVVKCHGIHRAETGQIILVRGIVPVPRHCVKRGEVQLHGEEVPHELVHHGVRALHILIPGHGSLEVPRVGEAVGTDGTEVRQLEVPLEDLENVATAGAVGEADREAVAALNDSNLPRGHCQEAALGDNLKGAELRDNEEVAIGIAEAAVPHIGLARVHVDGVSGLGAGTAGATHGEEPPDEVYRLCRHCQRAPPELVGSDCRIGEVAHYGIHGELKGVEGLVRH
mmetsp:Transcript_9802/g.28036  ORF Transcript_9802/g.28036 Transcript_9802/m.28036 type:complete len:322 (+) Transcript_9802:213-1178(+)